MRRSIVATIAAGVLVLGACGSDSSSDSGSDSGSASGVQAEAADAAIAAAKAEGIDLDEDCANDVAAKLSDEDAAAIVAAGPDGDADVSDEGTAIGSELMGCADNGQVIDAIIEQMKASGQDFDEDCVRDGLEGVDLAELTSADAGGSEDFINAMMKCVDLGG